MISNLTDCQNATSLLREIGTKYMDLSYTLMIVFLLGVVFVAILLWMYYQDKYLHALRTIARICEVKMVPDSELAIFVHQTKKLPSKKWREYYE